MVERILDSIDRRAKVLFYPSSCCYSDQFQDAPYDVVILNSKSIRSAERIGKVYCLNVDNNELLGLFHVKGIPLSAALIIRDGCVEGGNYECAAGEGFFGRLLPVAADTFDFFRDHGPSPLDVPARFEEFETPAYLEPFVRRSDPLGPLKSFHVTAFSKSERDFLLGRIRVVVVWDSIWRGYDQSDLVVVKKRGSTRRAIPNYLRGLLPNADLAQKFEFVTTSRLTSIQHLLQKAEDRKLSRLSLIPLGDGRYKTLADEIQRWHGNYPQEIYLYHLNRGDYQYFKRLRTD